MPKSSPEESSQADNPSRLRAFGRGALLGAAISGTCVAVAEGLHALGIGPDHAFAAVNNFDRDVLVTLTVSLLAGTVEYRGASPFSHDTQD